MTLIEKLNQNIPESAVEKRSGGGGKELSYLTGAYVINRLNEVLGQGNWGYSLKSLTKTFEGTVVQGYKKEEYFSTSYVAQLFFEANIEGKRAFFEEVGYGDGTDKSSPGKAHELATKEAVTDALKRAAKNLGISLGLGLYFKSGEYVDEQNLQVKPEARKAVTEVAQKPEATPAVKTAPDTDPTKTVLASELKNPFAETAAIRQEIRNSLASDTKILRTKIKSAYSVLEAQKKITKTEFVSKYLDGGKVDTLTDDQVIKTIELIKTNFKELSL